MKIRFPHAILVVLICTLLGVHVQSANQWQPDESAAIFTIHPNQVLGSPYFEEVLNTYGLISYGYSTFMADHHMIALQKEMGVKVEEVNEATLVIANFMDNMLHFPSFPNPAGISAAPPVGNSLVVMRAGSEINPDTFFEKFDRWASGPAFEPKKIQGFREGGRIAPEEIDKMSKAPRVKKELYAGMKNSERVGKTTLFSIPLGMLDQVLQNTDLRITLGIQTEKGETTFACGSRKGVLAFFEDENEGPESPQNSESGNFASFSIPMDGELLKQIETGKLSDPNGPLGPLATTLGESIYQIRNISGTAKFSGGRAHFDLILRCSDAESAQSIWSVAQASLGMMQLNVLREQMRDPRTKPILPLSFLNSIKLKHQENEVLAHIEALPEELMPWAANKKFP